MQLYHSFLEMQGVGEKKLQNLCEGAKLLTIMDIDGEYREVAEAFRAVIREAIATKYKTQKRFAQRARIGEDVVSRFLRGVTNRPHAQLVAAMAEAAEVSVHKWLDCFGYEPPIRIAEWSMRGPMTPGEIVGVLREGIKEADLTDQERQEILHALQELGQELSKKG